MRVAAGEEYPHAGVGIVGAHRQVPRLGEEELRVGKVAPGHGAVREVNLPRGRVAVGEYLRRALGRRRAGGVITSYSIHYTKLYDHRFRRRGGDYRPEFHALA